MKGEFISIETARIMADIEKENKELQQRIDKAIEFIDEWCFIDDNGKCICNLKKHKCTDLLNILRGDKNE